MGCITGWIIFILALVGFYFYFDVDSYSTIKTNELEKLQQQHQQQQQQQPTQPKQTIEQKHNGITPPNNKPERLNNLHDKQKAVELMRSERHTLSDEDKKIFDGVIETAKTNINNGVATQEDYNYLNMYKKLKGDE